jgi:carboxylesterase type B
MVAYWTRMAKTGNPNGGGDHEWPVASTEGDAYLEIGAIIQARSDSATAHCDFWDKVPMLWPHI